MKHLQIFLTKEHVFSIATCGTTFQKNTFLEKESPRLFRHIYYQIVLDSSVNICLDTVL